MRQNGNILFLILIAVVLFAALSYAVTQSSRGGGSVDSEQEQISIGGILNDFSLVKVAVDRLLLIDGCEKADVRYWHASRLNAADGDYYGDGSVPDCEVFDPNGGGAAYVVPPQAAQDQGSSEYMMLNLLIAGVGEHDCCAQDPATLQQLGTEIVMAVHVTRSMCLEVNEREGIANTGGNPPAYTVANTDEVKFPADTSHTFPHYNTGAFTYGGVSLGSDATRGPELYGHRLGCAEFTDSGGDPYYLLYNVLLDR